MSVCSSSSLLLLSILAISMATFPFLGISCNVPNYDNSLYSFEWSFLKELRGDIHCSIVPSHKVSSSQYILILFVKKRRHRRELRTSGQNHCWIVLLKLLELQSWWIRFSLNLDISEEPADWGRIQHIAEIIRYIFNWNVVRSHSRSNEPVGVGLLVEEVNL